MFQLITGIKLHYLVCLMFQSAIFIYCGGYVKYTCELSVFYHTI